MQRSTVLAITAATVAVTLLAGCADGDDTPNPCGSQPIVYVEENETYHCGSSTGMVVLVTEIDDDTKKRAKSSPGKAVTFGKNPAPAAPKVNTDKQPAPKAPAAPAAPRVKTGK